LPSSLREHPSKTFLLQIIRIQLPVNDDDSSAKGFAMQNKGSESSASLAGSSKRGVALLAQALGSAALFLQSPARHERARQHRNLASNCLALRPGSSNRLRGLDGDP
jgi:hypothetical protein